MNEREYLRMKRTIEEECRRKLEALDLVWDMSGGAKTGKRESGPRVRRGDLRGAIRNQVAHLTHDFTAEQVLAKIRAVDPELAQRIKAASLSSALKRMAENHEIEIVIRGAGKKPSVYRVPKATQLKAVGD